MIFFFINRSDKPQERESLMVQNTKWSIQCSHTFHKYIIYFISRANNHHVLFSDSSHHFVQCSSIINANFLLEFPLGHVKCVILPNANRESLDTVYNIFLRNFILMVFPEDSQYIICTTNVTADLPNQVSNP